MGNFSSDDQVPGPMQVDSLLLQALFQRADAADSRQSAIVCDEQLFDGRCGFVVVIDFQLIDENGSAAGVDDEAPFLESDDDVTQAIRVAEVRLVHGRFGELERARESFIDGVGNRRVVPDIGIAAEAKQELLLFLGVINRVRCRLPIDSSHSARCW